MKKPLVFGIVLVLIVLALVGYFASRRINQSAGEETLEKMIEAQTGAKVDIKSGSNGQDITIKTEDGQTQYSAGGDVKFPDGFPQQLVLVNDAKLMMASSSETGSSVTYLTNSDQTSVFNNYVSDLPGLGWKIVMQVNAGEGKMLNISKDGEAAYITIGDNDSKDKSAKTMVNIVWAKEE